MRSTNENSTTITSNLEELSLNNDNVIESFTDKRLEDEGSNAQITKLSEDVGVENLTALDDLIMKDTTWEELGVRPDITEGLIEMGFTKPSKIQASTFPLIMKKPYSHLVAQAHNGSGKTGAFGLGLISRMDESIKGIQGVVFAHTRELVNQIAGVLSKIAKKTKITVTALLNTSKDVEVGHVVVTTPGTFEICFLKKRSYAMDKIRVLVLDEADYMITQEVTQKVCEKTFEYFEKTNTPVQVLFFSATFTPDNFRTIKKYYKKAHMLEIKKEALTLKNVRQMFFKAEKREEKIEFIEEYLKRNIEQERVIIFVNTKDFTVRLQQTLVMKGYKVFLLMGGNMDPKERDATIESFNQGKIQILITTNVLARGFDEKLVKLIINFDLPVTRTERGDFLPDYENYLHRIGRTGRFGTKGIGLTLVSSDEEIENLKKIEKHYNSKIEEIKSLDELITEFKKILVQS